MRTFGDYPLIRILDFLMYSRDFDYPITEIAKNANVNFQTLKKLWPKLNKVKELVPQNNIHVSELKIATDGSALAQRLLDHVTHVGGERRISEDHLLDVLGGQISTDGHGE